MSLGLYSTFKDLKYGRKKMKGKRTHFQKLGFTPASPEGEWRSFSKCKCSPPFFFVSLLRYWTRWPLWRHRVALSAAVGVFNTTTARKKMMKILEIGNILMTLSRPRSELSGSSRHSQGRMHRRFLSIGNRYIRRNTAKCESASRVRINTLTWVNSHAYTGLRKSPR